MWIPSRLINQASYFHGGLMLRLILAIVMLCSIPGASFAATLAENQADSFVHVYSSLCMKHVNDLDTLRGKLEPVPQLPKEKAAHFLVGHEGNAWPVPDKYGTFVLALPTGWNFCAIYARRADTRMVEKSFAALVATAPPPLVARQTSDELAQTSANGQTHTIAYEWYAPGAQRGILFTLTTASSATAQIQAMGSAAIITR
jgi:hypothetical protein